MRYYRAIIHKDRDSAYGVEFPDVPGCFSAADTLADIIPNAVEALALYFEDDGIQKYAPFFENWPETSS